MKKLRVLQIKNTETILVDLELKVTSDKSHDTFGTQPISAISNDHQYFKSCFKAGKLFDERD